MTIQVISIPLTSGWALAPVEVDGKIEVVDTYDPDGDWHGSCRTIQLARKYVEGHIGLQNAP